MTKKTNSLIIRYGYSTFWYNKCLAEHRDLNILRLENIIYVEFKKKKLAIFKLYYTLNTLNILVYNIMWFTKDLINCIIKYYKKVLNLKLVVLKFGISAAYIISFLRVCGIYKPIKLSVFVLSIHYLKLLLLVKKYFIMYIYMCKRCWEFCVVWVKKLSISYILATLVESVRVYYLTGNKVKKKKIQFCRLKAVSGTLSFKLLSIQVVNVLFWLLGKVYSVVLGNALLLVGWLIDIRQEFKFGKPLERFLLYTVILAGLYNNSRVLCEYIAEELMKKKMHYRILSAIVEILSFYYWRDIFPIKGIKLRVSGKLAGKMRKTKYEYRLGITKSQVLKQKLSYYMSNSYTKFGILSVKLWLINASDSI